MSPNTCKLCIQSIHSGPGCRREERFPPMRAKPSHLESSNPEGFRELLKIYEPLRLHDLDNASNVELSQHSRDLIDAYRRMFEIHFVAMQCSFNGCSGSINIKVFRIVGQPLLCTRQGGSGPIQIDIAPSFRRFCQYRHPVRKGFCKAPADKNKPLPALEILEANRAGFQCGHKRRWGCRDCRSEVSTFFGNKTHGCLRF